MYLWEPLVLSVHTGKLTKVPGKNYLKINPTLFQKIRKALSRGINFLSKGLNVALNVEIEYIESPDESERIKSINKILAEGVYVHLKNEGLLRSDPKRAQKISKALQNAREIINKAPVVD